MLEVGLHLHGTIGLDPEHLGIIQNYISSAGGLVVIIRQLKDEFMLLISSTRTL